MENINEIRKELSEIKKEISSEELAEKSAQVMCESPIKELIENNPILALAFTIFSAELNKKIFGEKTESENTSTEESEG